MKHTLRQEGESKDKATLGGAGLDIFLPALAATVPALVLGGAVLWIVFNHQVGTFSPSTTYFPKATDGVNSNVYYVNYDSNRLITISGWASNTAALLPGFVMTLYSYHAAVSIRADSRSESPDLPTPYHLNLLLAMKTGGIQPLWDWLVHTFSRKRERQSPVLSATGRILGLATFLGILVWASDTWLHITTTPINIDQIISRQTPTHQYSRTLPPNCGVGPLNNCTAIIIDPIDDGRALVKEPLELSRVWSNQSTINQIASTNITGKRLSYLAPADPIQGLDYRATTLASQSECTFITSRCLPSGLLEGFRCSPLFTSNATNQSVSVTANLNTMMYAFFADAEGSITFDYYRPPNPFHALFAVEIGSTVSRIVSPGHDIELEERSCEYFLSCTTTLTNFTYTIVNGTMREADTTLLTNPVINYNLLQPNRDGVSGAQLLDGGLIAVLQNTTAEALETFERSYDTSFLAPAASISELQTNIAEQQRQFRLVSQIQKSALFTFISTLLASIMLGVVMIVLAVRGMMRGSRDVQARLSILGLVSSRFEAPDVSGAPATQSEGLFLERTGDCIGRIRVGLLRNREGGWNFESWALKYEAKKDSVEDGIPLVGVESRAEEESIVERHDQAQLPEVGSIRPDSVRTI